MTDIGERRTAKSLSKSILDMKFMKKSKEAALKAAEDEEARRACSNQLTEVMRLGGLRTVVEPSFAPCEGLASPRQSYLGANPEIEKLLAEEKISTKLEPDADVQADEVAQATYAKNKLRQPPRKKPRFMKPTD